MLNPAKYFLPEASEPSKITAVGKKQESTAGAALKKIKQQKQLSFNISLPFSPTDYIVTAVLMWKEGLLIFIPVESHDPLQQ